MVNGFRSFATHVENVRSTATEPAFLLSAGDNFLSGLVVATGNSQTPVRYLDAELLSLLSVDASAVGNHEFDNGPAYAADFLEAFNTTHLSANLIVDGDSDLLALKTTGRLASRAVLHRDGVSIGVVGVITEALASITQLGETVSVVYPTNGYTPSVNAATIAAIQDEIDALTSVNIDKVVLLSHNQDPLVDLDMIPRISGVDVLVSGGGSQFTTQQKAAGATDADGFPVVLVSSEHGYVELANVVVSFDTQGHVTGSTQVGVNTASPATNVTLPYDAQITSVIDVIDAFQTSLENEIIGITDVTYDTTREIVRRKRSAMGTVAADAHSSAWCSPHALGRNAIQESCILQQLVDCQAENHITCPDNCQTGNPIVVGHQNGGGIRAQHVVPAGSNLSVKIVMDDFPFDNEVSVARGTTYAELWAFVQHGLSGGGSGSFGQLSSDVFIVHDNYVLRSIYVFVCNAWRLATTDDTFIVVGNSFVLGGGDGYPSVGTDQVDMNIRTGAPTSYAQSVIDFVQGALSGTIPTKYAESNVVDLTFNDGALLGGWTVGFTPLPEAIRCAERRQKYSMRGCCA
tara:strand:- start:720 stop:2441 length:1722 start_codon:yes stop_codon:yes gene_type:complete